MLRCDVRRKAGRRHDNVASEKGTGSFFDDPIRFSPLATPKSVSNIVSISDGRTMTNSIAAEVIGQLRAAVAALKSLPSYGQIVEPRDQFEPRVVVSISGAAR